MRFIGHLTLVLALLFAGVVLPFRHTHDRASHHRLHGVSFGHTHWPTAHHDQPTVTGRHGSHARSIDWVSAPPVGKFVPLVAILANAITEFAEPTRNGVTLEPAPRGNDPPRAGVSRPRGPPTFVFA